MATEEQQEVLTEFSSEDNDEDDDGDGDDEDGDNEGEDGTNEDEHEDEGNQQDASESANGPVGLIYARTSSYGQCEKTEDGFGGSIDSQISTLEELADENDIELPFDPIVDEAQTGTDFNRDGIWEVLQKVDEHDIDYILVEKVDRIGRSAAETLHFIYKLQEEYGTIVLTPGGERDVDTIDGLLRTTLLSLLSEVQNEIRTSKAKKDKVRYFLDEKKWKCKSPTIPLGYEEDDEWLTVDPEEKTIVRDIFRKFVECGYYGETQEYIDEKYGSEVLNGHRVKTILTESAYIGKPAIPDEWLVDTHYDDGVVDDPPLHLLREEEDAEVEVREEVFEEAQELVEQKNEKHSTDDETKGKSDYLEKFGLFAVVRSSDVVRLVHHCGKPLVKDGTKTLKGREKIHTYWCRHCETTVDPSEYYRRWPKQIEREQMELIQKILNNEFSLEDSE